MYSRNLFVLDFVRRFFVSCAQIFEAYVDEIRVRLAENQPQKQVQERLREYILQKRGIFMFGKKKKVKRAERHVDYKVSSENLAMPELHIGEDKGEEQPEKKDDGFITYENVAIPEVHIKKRK